MKLKLRRKHIHGPVYEASNGFKIHAGGLIKIGPSQHDFRQINDSSQNHGFFNILKIYGGNRRRALMAWAETFDPSLIEWRCCGNPVMDNGYVCCGNKEPK